MNPIIPSYNEIPFTRTLLLEKNFVGIYMLASIQPELTC